MPGAQVLLFGLEPIDGARFTHRHRSKPHRYSITDDQRAIAGAIPVGFDAAQ
jgi:hypothetical protein